MYNLGILSRFIMNNEKGMTQFIPNHWSKKVAFPWVLHSEETSVREEIVQFR